MTTQGPAQVRLPALTVLRAAVTCQLMLDGGGVSCQVALWGASLRPAQPACSIRIQSLHGRSESGDAPTEAMWSSTSSLYALVLHRVAP